MPRFSVVVPAYNAGATLPETLDAVLAQEYSDWECLVVDDGSTDDTASIVEEYVARDDRFKLIRQQNRGTAGAYLTGVGAAADLLVICAADDLLLPAHLKTMDEFIRANPDFDIYSSNGQFLYQESRSSATVYTRQEWSQERSLTFEEVVARCFFSVGVVFRSQVYESTGGHRLGVYADDYDLWLRAMVRGSRHRYTPRILSVHRVSDFQQTANLVKVFAANIEVCQHLLADYPMRPAQKAAVEQGIALNQRMLADHAAEQRLQRQSRDLRSAVERLVGARCTEPVMRAIHTVSWITRPVRRMMARQRVR